MTFAWPLALCGLGVVALALVGYLIAQRRRRRYVVRFTNFDLLENVVSATPRWRRHIPAVLGLLALTALVVGLARPQMAVAVAREEATVVLAMDSSGSMTATDVAPDRMTAAREAASSFVDDLPDGFRVGLVSFSDQADVVVPPTADRQEAVDALGALVADNGTALGDAIARSVDVGLQSLDEQSTADTGTGKKTPLIVLLLSDGANTTGDYEPLEAAQKAADAGVPVYTVALGTENGTVQGPDGYGGTRTIRVPPDPTTLRDVAEATGGQFFEAADEAALRSVYDEIGSQVGVDHEQKELTVAFTAAGALLLLLGGALSTLWFGRIP
jgi:Ca-activated chloride channel family protein